MDQINLLFTFDRNFIQQFLCAFRSLIFYHQHTPLDVYILFNDKDKNSLQEIETAIQKLQFFGTFEYHILLFEDDRLKSFPIRNHDHVSLATYIRLFMTEFLPSHIEKIIYLDCDLIIRDNLTELWETNLIDCYVGAVSHFRYNPIKFYTHFYQFKGFNRKTFDIFNAGVLLINLELWRKDQLLPKFLRFIKNNYQYLRLHDQDVLNYFFMDHWYPLDWKWNFCVHVTNRPINHSPKLAKIIHFSGRIKPWQPKYPTQNHGLDLWKLFWKTDLPLINPRIVIETEISCVMYMRPPKVINKNNAGNKNNTKNKTNAGNNKNKNTNTGNNNLNNVGNNNQNNKNKDKNDVKKKPNKKFNKIINNIQKQYNSNGTKKLKNLK